MLREVIQTRRELESKGFLEIARVFYVSKRESLLERERKRLKRGNEGERKEVEVGARVLGGEGK